MIDAPLQCENSSCPKIPSPSNIPFPHLYISHCCSAILCSHCFNHPSHSCHRKITISLHHTDSTPCSRCKTKLAVFDCLSCIGEAFCSQCCKNVHSVSKFSFHTINPLNSVKSIPSRESQKIEPLQQLSQKQNLKQTKDVKISQKLDQIEYQDKNQVKDQHFTTFLQLQHKLDTKKLSINLRKSEAKIQQLALRQKWTKMEGKIDEIFKTLLSKIQEKYESVKLILKLQAEISINQSLKYGEQIKQAQNEVSNMRFLLPKKGSSSSSDSELMDFLETKFRNFEQKIKSFNDKTNFKNVKQSVSKQFIDYIKKITEEIDGSNIAPLIKNQIQPKVLKSDDCLMNLRDKQKKKTLTNLNKTKNSEIQTAKKALNISVSNNSNYENLTQIKNRKRKISIELYQSQSIMQLKENEAKIKELQRIKSFEFLSFTNSKKSLESITELKTEKKVVQKPTQYVLKKQHENQKLSLNYIRTKIQNPNSNEEGEDNFIKTSSQLVFSSQTLPTYLGTARPKPTLHPVLSPKGNTNLKQKEANCNNCNKTFQGSMNSATSKMTITGFKSPNAKSRNPNELRQQPFGLVQEFDSKTLKKNMSTRMIPIKE